MTVLPIVEATSGPAAASKAAAKGTYAFLSLGCPKNLVDSERMLGLLQIDGYELVREPSGADFVVVNTCGFIEQARAESFSAIDEMLKLKKQGLTKGVLVTGCLAERQKESLLETRPDIDALIGVFGREQVAKVADRLIGDVREQQTVFQPAPIRALPDRDRLRITPRHFAYLKISEGCDRLCTFCAIPKMRGKHASKPIEEIVAEARELAASGARELIVVAQDTTYYGLDIYGEPRLAELLRRLEEIDGVDWLRLMYFYPMHISDDLVRTIGASAKILPYIDLPLQHINDTMLRRMSRRVTRHGTEEIIARLRDGIPNLALRTTFITGFPGETDEQFEELCEFVSEQRFERLGVFTYSYEPDTPAAQLDGHLDEDVKNERRDTLMLIQQRIAFARNADRVGQRYDVLIDRPLPDESDVWIGRTYADAPDVDAAVYVTANKRKLAPGKIVPVEIVAPAEYDLAGLAVGRPR
jgi:ribosomal protein S12 methylthiotransferase